jgi:hypothetical protein
MYHSLLNEQLFNVYINNIKNIKLIAYGTLMLAVQYPVAVVRNIPPLNVKGN